MQTALKQHVGTLAEKAPKSLWIVNLNGDGRTNYPTWVITGNNRPENGRGNVILLPKKIPTNKSENDGQDCLKMRLAAYHKALVDASKALTQYNSSNTNI